MQFLERVQKSTKRMFTLGMIIFYVYVVLFQIVAYSTSGTVQAFVVVFGTFGLLVAIFIGGIIDAGKQDKKT